MDRLTEFSAQAQRALRRACSWLCRMLAATRRRAYPSAHDHLGELVHELRTPLAGLLGMSELLLAGPLEPPQRERAHRIRQAGEHMLALVESLGHQCGDAAHTFPDVDEIIHLHDLAHDLVALHAVHAHSRGLQLELKCDPALAPPRRGDARRLRQVLINLLHNAIKFTEHGVVQVRVLAGAAADAVAFEFADTGPGLPAPMAARLSAPSMPDRIDRQRGLWLVGRLVRELGGTVETAASRELGTRIRIDLPLRRAIAVPARHRILVVENDDMARRTLMNGLVEIGYEPYGAANALEALRLTTLEQLGAVLIAPELPGVDGTALATALKATHRHVWRIALLRLDQAGSFGARRHAIFDAVLVLPLQPSALDAALEGSFSAAGAAGPTAHAPRPPERAPAQGRSPG